MKFDHYVIIIKVRTFTPFKFILGVSTKFTCSILGDQVWPNQVKQVGRNIWVTCTMEYCTFNLEYLYNEISYSVNYILKF